MWAEQPWSGFYVVNSPIWATAHYTQATQPGWFYLPVGSGSGMLPTGGSYVSLVSPGGCSSGAAGADHGAAPGLDRVHLTLVVQTMEYDLSKCFKDSHPPFDVASEANVSFTIDAPLLARLKASSSAPFALYGRRTHLNASDRVAPATYIPLSDRHNTYFEAQRIAWAEAAGSATFSLTLRRNEVWTVSTVDGAGSRGDGSDGPDHGLPPIAKPARWSDAHRDACFALDGLPLDAALVDAVVAMDQQGVWESHNSRDAAAGLTMQQVIPEAPDEWHGSGRAHPFTFVGPAANLSSLGPHGRGAAVSADVMPSAAPGGWAGVGFGRPTLKTAPEAMALRLFANGTWSFDGKSGMLARGATWAAAWHNLSVSIAPAVPHGSTPVYVAAIDGTVVASGAYQMHAPSLTTAFATLSSSYSAGSNSEFRAVCLELIASDTPTGLPPSPPPAPPGPPTPVPRRPGVAFLDAACGGGDTWTFSGEDQGEAGTLRPRRNSSLCLDLDAAYDEGNLELVACAGDPASAAAGAQRWRWDSAAQTLSSVQTRPCAKATHGTNCSNCLDVKHGGLIDLFDCKPADANQLWAFDVAAGAGPVRRANGRGCLAVSG